MSTIKCILILFLIYSAANSQTPRFEYQGRLTPSIKKEALYFANSLTDIVPELHRYMVLSYNDRLLLDQQLRSIGGYYITPEAKYDKLLKFEFVEISVNCGGIIRTSCSTGNILTAQQKNLLNKVDHGSEIHITIQFKYKNLADSIQSRKGNYVVTVVPETEAVYMGGFEGMSEYITKNIFEKVTGKGDVNKILQTIVKFTIDEEGRIVNAKISRSSEDLKIDRMVLDAINRMPKWNPAKNATGIKVKEEFNILFSRGC